MFDISKRVVLLQLISIVDCVGMLTEQSTAERAGTYWRVMKKRLADEGNEPVTSL